MSVWDFVGLNETAWVDVPRIEELQAAPFLPDSLHASLRAYRDLPCTSAPHLTERQIALGALVEQLDQLDLSSHLRPLQNWLMQLARRKSKYLECLSQIFKENWHQSERLDGYLNDRSDLKDQHLLSLHLTRDRYHFPERSVFWGNYAMECLDPCHRQLPEMVRVWHDENSQVPYLLWLEKFSGHQHDRWVRYLTLAEQSELEIKCIDHRLCKLSGRPLSCPERQHFIFIIDLQGRLFATRADPHLSHASFTRGRAVLASGIFQANQGNLTHLKFESGHYLSALPHWWQAIQLFEQLGVTWKEGLRVTVFDRFRYISTKISPVAMASRVSFQAALGL